MNEIHPSTLCLVLHDVAPATWPACERVLLAISEVAELPLTLLAVPRYHCAPRSRDFEQWLRFRAADGDEVALHGYTHQDDGQPRGTLDHLRRRVYTAGEGEFCALQPSEALQRVIAGAQWFRTLGLPLYGFVAPAWLLGPGGWEALRWFDFRYTCTLSRIVLLPERRALNCQSLVYSARSAWRRHASIVWNRALATAQWHRPLLRLELHPGDADNAALRLSWQRLLDAALCERVPLTLAQAVRQLRSDEPQRELRGEQPDRRTDRDVARVVQAEHDA
jgi:predicted deacetylase